jgi:hypothetical protein
MASTGYFLGVLYLSYYACIGYNGFAFSWYLPSVGLFGLVVLARAPFTLARKLGLTAWYRIFVRAIPAGLVVTYASIFLMDTNRMRIQQRIIENETRKQMGIWLGEHVAPAETIYSECLGYTGYFSNRKILDFPGLVSPEVVCVRKRGGTLPEIVRDLKPNWLVLRPFEIDILSKHRDTQLRYQHVTSFTAEVQFARYEAKNLSGLQYLRTDGYFAIFKCHPSTAEHPAPSGGNTD